MNNKKTIPDTNILFLNSETTTWEVLNHIVLQEYLVSGGRCLRGVCVQSAWETAKRTVLQPQCSLVFERSVVILIFFQTHFPFPSSSQPTTEWIFGPVLGPEGGLVASTERKLHRYDRMSLRKVGFDGKCALLVGPHHLYDCGVL